MGFRIDIRTSYIDIDAFYFNPEWEQYCRNDSERELRKKCLSLSPLNVAGIEEVVEIIKESGYAQGQCLAMFPNEAEIEVDGTRIENPFSDFRQWEMPSPESLLRRSIRSSFPNLKMSVVQQNFLYFKIWENSGGFSYEGEGSFLLNKLTYKGGVFLYDDEAFDLTDGEGSSSYEVFYRDSVRINV